MIPNIPVLNWQPGLTFSGWIADLSKTEELRIVKALQGTVTVGYQLLYITRRAPDQLLGEFATDDAAKVYARTWIGDDGE